MKLKEPHIEGCMIQSESVVETWTWKSEAWKYHDLCSAARVSGCPAIVGEPWHVAITARGGRLYDAAAAGPGLLDARVLRRLMTEGMQFLSRFEGNMWQDVTMQCESCWWGAGFEVCYQNLKPNILAQHRPKLGTFEMATSPYGNSPFWELHCFLLKKLANFFLIDPGSLRKAKP